MAPCSFVFFGNKYKYIFFFFSLSSYCGDQDDTVKKNDKKVFSHSTNTNFINELLYIHIFIYCVTFILGVNLVHLVREGPELDRP